MKNPEISPSVKPNALDAFRLDGKVAAITGVASGIGAATAQLFGLAGAKVVGGDVRSEAGKRTIDLIKQNGGEANFITTDITERTHVESLVQRCIDEYGGIDIICNVAGSMFPGLLEEVGDEDIDAGLNLNLKGALYGCQAAIPHMKRKGSGCIINVSSGAIDAPYEGIGIYALTKAAVAMMTMTLAKEVGKYGIRVNAIAPGTTLTPFTTWRLYDQDGNLDKKRYNEFIEFAKSLSPVGSYGEAIDQAYLMLYLASPAGRFCDGNIFRSNGGQTMMW